MKKFFYLVITCFLLGSNSQQCFGNDFDWIFAPTVNSTKWSDIEKNIVLSDDYYDRMFDTRTKEDCYIYKNKKKIYEYDNEFMICRKKESLSNIIFLFQDLKTEDEVGDLFHKIGRYLRRRFIMETPAVQDERGMELRSKSTLVNIHAYYYKNKQLVITFQPFDK